MESQTYFKTTCAHCGGRIEAPAEGVGMWIQCPHCAQKTQLGAANSGTAVAKKSRAWVWVVLCGMVVMAVVGGVLMMRRTAVPVAQTPAHVAVQKPAPAPEPDFWKGLKPGPVTIDKSPNSRLVYATGTVRNDTDKQRYGVKVTLDVLDGNGEKLGTTMDYAQFIDAHKEWTFKALVAFPKAASAKIASITEE